MTRHTARLEVDELGDRILPSATLLTAPVTHSSKVITGNRNVLDSLAGSGQGTYVPAPTAFGLGARYSLRATGSIIGMGTATLTGTLKAPAPNATGAVTGLLVLTTSQGTITVSLTSAAQSGRAPLPTSFQYTIVASSGVFFGSSASGTMHLTLARNSHGASTLSFSF